VKWIHTDVAQKWLISGIVLFNLLDIIFTLFSITAGFAVEANPFMHEMIEESELKFAIVKISLVSLCCFLLWRLRDFKITRVSTVFCFLTYGALMIYHIAGVVVSLTT
jgi:Ca2+/Na+ antiporter